MQIFTVSTFSVANDLMAFCNRLHTLKLNMKYAAQLETER